MLTYHHLLLRLLLSLADEWVLSKRVLIKFTQSTFHRRRTCSDTDIDKALYGHIHGVGLVEYYMSIPCSIIKQPLLVSLWERSTVSAIAAPANVLKCAYHMRKCSAPTQRGIPLSKSTMGYTMHLVPCPNSKNWRRSTLWSSLTASCVRRRVSGSQPTSYQSTSDGSSIDWCNNKIFDFGSHTLTLTVTHIWRAHCHSDIDTQPIGLLV